MSLAAVASHGGLQVYQTQPWISPFSTSYAQLFGSQLPPWTLLPNIISPTMKKCSCLLCFSFFFFFIFFWCARTPDLRVAQPVQNRLLHLILGICWLLMVMYEMIRLGVWHSLYSFRVVQGLSVAPAQSTEYNQPPFNVQWDRTLSCLYHSQAFVYFLFFSTYCLLLVLYKIVYVCFEFIVFTCSFKSSKWS